MIILNHSLKKNEVNLYYSTIIGILYGNEK
jgi:hypothetical protein